MKKKISIVAVIAAFCLVLTSCDIAAISNSISELKGSLIGNKYNIRFYDNYGEKFLSVKGDKINIEGNTVETISYDSDGNYTYTPELSSVITINIDGSAIESCGDTVIFAGDKLEPVIDFVLQSEIDSEANNITDNTIISSELNKYKNLFGKKRIVVIQSQLGHPICAFEGDDVYWEVPDDLPKMTKLMIDDKPLYIHRANFQIIDSSLLQ